MADEPRDSALSENADDIDPDLPVQEAVRAQSGNSAVRFEEKTSDEPPEDGQPESERGSRASGESRVRDSIRVSGEIPEEVDRTSADVPPKEDSSIKPSSPQKPDSPPQGAKKPESKQSLNEVPLEDDDPEPELGDEEEIEEGEGSEGDEDEEGEEEDDDEEEGEEEDGEEEDDEEEQEEMDQESPEEIEARMKQKQDLIERYIEMKKDYKFLNKKNSYLQDKLYKISVRKGFIVENKPEEETEKSKKRKKKISIKHSEEEDPEDLDMDEDEDLFEGERSERMDSIEPGSIVGGGGLRNFMEAALESKYNKIVRRIWLSEESKMNDSVAHEMNLDKFREKSEKWEKIHQEKFLDFMDRVRAASDTAIDSNTGSHIQRWETEQYVEEVSKIHTKLCTSLVKMYQNRHGLEFALKRLEETEVQGEGLQMLEYEQLQAENSTLKEKLEDRQKDVENIKGKIAHAVQILAHFRECMHRLTEKMEDGNTKLSLINKRVYQVREITDVVTQRYEIFKEEEKNLISVSGLLDNTKLLRDFEKTHFDVMDLKEEKRKLQKLLQGKSREIEETQAKIRDIQLNLPRLLELAKEAKSSKADTSTVPELGKKSSIDPKAEKCMKSKRLEWLLETRHLDPKTLPGKTDLIKLPPIAEKYRCHFQI